MITSAYKKWNKNGWLLRGLAAGLVFLVVPLYSTGQAAASADYLNLSPEQLLDAEIISVSKRPETVAQANAAVYVITSEDIIRSGVTTIPDALRMAPGVEVAKADSNSWAINIRGFNSALANKLLVLIDGRTIYNPVFGGVLWEAHDLMLEDVERIEVIRGPGGTLWGANAVNGVINIITKRAQDTQGKLASAIYGNEEQGTYNVRQGGSFGDDGFYRMYARAFNRDSSHKPGGGEAYDAWNGYRSGFRTDWGGKFTLQGDVYHTGAEQLRTNYALVAPFATVTKQALEYDGVNLLGHWTDARDDGSQLSIQSYIDWARRNEPVNFIDNRIIYDLETQYNMASRGIHEIIMGAGLRFSGDNEEGNRNVSFSPKSRRDILYSTFLQDKITLVPDKWFLTLGSKLEHNDYSGFEAQPSARLQWHPNTEQTIWSAVSRAVRTPTPVEEDLTSTIATGAGVRFAFVPNDNFKSETLTAYELGYRNQITPTISADVAAFYNEYDHLETYAFLAPFLVNNGIDPPHFFVPVQFQNNMNGATHGFEIATSWAASPDLKITANYSLLHLSVDALSKTQEGAEDLYPSQMASLRASWNINKAWTLDSTAYYTSKLRAVAVGNYVRLDMNLGWKIREGMRFNLTGQDLLDNAHREFGAANDLNSAEIQRSIFGKLTWEL